MHSCPVTHGKVNGTLTLFSEYAQSKLFNDASMDKLSALVCPLKHHYMGTYFYKCEGPGGGGGIFITSIRPNSPGPTFFPSSGLRKQPVSWRTDFEWD